MTKFYAICDPDGSVRGFGRCDDAELANQQPLSVGGSIVEISLDQAADIDGNIEGFRLDSGSVVARDAMAPTVSASTIIADGVDICAIDDIPAGSTIRITGALSYGPAEVTDPLIELSASAPGTITVLLTNPPLYAPWSVVIHAT